MAKIYFIIVLIVQIIATTVTEGKKLIPVSEAAKGNLKVEFENSEKRVDRKKR